jgi:hypothetical protein
MKTAMRVSASAVLTSILCIGSISLSTADEPVGGKLKPAPGRTAAGGPRIPEPQGGHFDATQVGPIQPIPKRELAGRNVSQGKPDLIVEGLGFTLEGKVRYFILNLSNTAANEPFVVDIHFNGQRRDTVKHNGLPPLSQQRVESSLANPGGCAEAQLRAVADSQQIVAEASEGNNLQVRSQIPPCADLVVRIEKDDVSSLKYKAKVKVTNRGNRSTGRHFLVLVRESSVPAGVIATPPTDKRIEDLDAGKSTSFSYGGEHFKTTTVGYHAIVDRFDDVKESDESNNDVRKSLP